MIRWHDTPSGPFLCRYPHLPGSAVTSAESPERHKYVCLNRGYIFEPFGEETLDAWGLRTSTRAWWRGSQTTRGRNAGFYFGQRICIAIRGNHASILDTLLSGNGMDRLGYDFIVKLVSYIFRLE